MAGAAVPFKKHIDNPPDWRLPLRPYPTRGYRAPLANPAPAAATPALSHPRIPRASITPGAILIISSRSRHPRSIGDWSSDVCSSDLIWLSSAFPVGILPDPALIILPPDKPGHGEVHDRDMRDYSGQIKQAARSEER